MRILLSNDDGAESPGIQRLAEALRQQKYDVWVVAPSQDRSTVGHSLTLHKPLHLKSLGHQMYAVSGSPADCVYMATRHLMKTKPDLIISGINRGANLGNDLFYSGTVAAAREGVLFGVKSLAVSLCAEFPISNSHQLHWETAVQTAAQLIPKIADERLTFDDTVLNLNVPDIPLASLKGLKVSRQGRRYYFDSVEERVDPRGRKYYWVGGKYRDFEPIPGSDCVDVDNGYASLVPLRIDTTNYDLQKRMLEWEK